MAGFEGVLIGRKQCESRAFDRVSLSALKCCNADDMRTEASVHVLTAESVNTPQASLGFDS